MMVRDRSAIASKEGGGQRAFAMAARRALNPRLNGLKTGDVCA
jgi:hypothetical protein